MAHSLSAKKRVRQNAKKQAANRARTSMVKTQVKKFLETLSGSDVEKAKEQYRLTVKKLDKVSATSAMHKKTAARTKSRLAKKLNSFVKANTK